MRRRRVPLWGRCGDCCMWWRCGGAPQPAQKNVRPIGKLAVPEVPPGKCFCQGTLGNLRDHCGNHRRLTTPHISSSTSSPKFDSPQFTFLANSLSKMWCWTPSCLDPLPSVSPSPRTPHAPLPVAAC
eukprot:gene16599-biopygen15833